MINFNASFHLYVTSSSSNSYVKFVECVCEKTYIHSLTYHNRMAIWNELSSVELRVFVCLFVWAVWAHISPEITIAYVDIHSLTVFSFELFFWLLIFYALTVIKYQSRTRIHIKCIHETATKTKTTQRQRDTHWIFMTLQYKLHQFGLHIKLNIKYAVAIERILV